MCILAKKDLVSISINQAMWVNFVQLCIVLLLPWETAKRTRHGAVKLPVREIENILETLGQYHKLPYTFTRKEMSDKTWTKMYPFDDKFGLFHNTQLRRLRSLSGSAMSDASGKWERNSSESGTKGSNP